MNTNHRVESNEFPLQLYKELEISIRHNIPIFYLRLTAAFTTKNQFLYGHRLLANTHLQCFAHFWLVHIKGLNIVLRKKDEEEKENHQCWQTPHGEQM